MAYNRTKKEMKNNLKTFLNALLIFSISAVLPVVLAVYTLTGDLESELLGYEMQELNFVGLFVTFLLLGFLGVCATLNYLEESAKNNQ